MTLKYLDLVTSEYKYSCAIVFHTTTNQNLPQKHNWTITFKWARNREIPINESEVLSVISAKGTRRLKFRIIFNIINGYINYIQYFFEYYRIVLYFLFLIDLDVNYLK